MSRLLELCCGGLEARRSDGHESDAKAFSSYDGKGGEEMRLPPVDIFEELDFDEAGVHFKNAETSDRYMKIFIEEQAKIFDEQEAEEKQQLMELDIKEKQIEDELRAVVERNKKLDEQVRNFEAHFHGSEPLDLNSHTELARMSGFSHMTGFSNRDLDLLSSFLNAKPEDDVKSVPGAHESCTPSLADPNSAFVQELEESLAASDDEEAAQDADTSSSPNANPFELLQAGVEACYRQDYLRSKQYLKRCARLSVRQQDEMLTARALGNLANVYEMTSRSAKALSLYRTCIALLRKNDDIVREQYVTANALLSCVSLKKYEDAIGYGQRQLEILRASRNRLSPHTEPHDALDDIEQQITDTENVIRELESARAEGYDVSFDVRAHERNLFAVQASKSVYSASS